MVSLLAEPTYSFAGAVVVVAFEISAAVDLFDLVVVVDILVRVETVVYGV